jgi:hypothetical protein
MYDFGANVRNPVVIENPAAGLAIHPGSRGSDPDPDLDLVQGMHAIALRASLSRARRHSSWALDD